MIYVIVILILVITNGYVAIRKLFDYIHMRGSKALGGEEILLPRDHPLYDAIENFRKQDHEIWKIENDQLQLAAYFYPQEKVCNKTVVLTHGFGVDHNSLNIFGQLFYKLGFNVLMPDNRASGQSDGKYMTFGFFEKNDLNKWIKKLNKTIPDQEVLLFGASMGAATELQAVTIELPDNVVAIIEDSSYTSALEIIKIHAAKKVGQLANFVVPMLSFYAKQRFGFDYKEVSALEALKQTDLPIMFVVGGEDNVVPPYMGQKLYDSYTGSKVLYENPQGIHIRSYNQNPEEYEQKINSFLKDYFKE